MSLMIMQADALNLPEPLALQFRGKKVELAAKGETITIQPVRSAIFAARGMRKGGKFDTAKLLAQKQLEKDMEYGDALRT